MSLVWAAPEWLWMLGAGPVLIALAFFTRREKRLQVASLLPWRTVLALPRPRPQRRPLDLEMLASIAAPLLILLALLGPTVELQNQPAPPVFVIDTSISMGTRAKNGTTRFDRALEGLRAEGEKRTLARFTVYGTHTPVPVSMDDTAGNTMAALRALSLSRQPEAIQRATLLAVAAAHPGRPVCWFSDRLPPVDLKRCYATLVGPPADNVAILEAQAEEASVFVTLANYGTKERAVPVRIAGTERIVSLAPGAVRSFSQAVKKKSSRITVSLGDIKDSLLQDNSTTVSLNTLRAAVDPNLPKAVGIALVAMCEAELLPREQAARCDLLVTSKEQKSLPAHSILLLAPKAPCYGLLELKAPREARTMLPGRLPAVSFNQMPVPLVPDVTLPAGAQVLAEAHTKEGARPFVARWTWKNRDVFWIAALPPEWLKTPGFPVLMGALLRPLTVGSLPGVCESDNRLPAEEGETRPAPLVQTEAIPLDTWFVLIAALLAAWLAAVKYRRRQKVAKMALVHQ